MKKVTIISAVAAAAIFLLGVSACGSTSPSHSGGANTNGSTGSTAGAAADLIHPGKLTVCTNPPYAPFETLQGTQIVGLDMDIMNEVAKSLGVTLEPISTAFEVIESGAALNAKSCDAVASGISINATRESKFSFSYPYFNDEDGVLTKDSSITDAASLKGQKVVVERATTGETWVKAQGLQYVETTDLGTQIQALKAGQADAAITDEIVLLPYATGGYHIAFSIPNGEQFGFGVSKSNPGLLKAVDSTLATITQNGTMASLFSKYSIPASSIVQYNSDGTPEAPTTAAAD